MIKLKLFINSCVDDRFSQKNFDFGESLLTTFIDCPSDIVSDNESTRFEKINIYSMKFLD